MSNVVKNNVFSEEIIKGLSLKYCKSIKFYVLLKDGNQIPTRELKQSIS